MMESHSGHATGCPAEVLDWIPWYVDGGLTDEQAGAVEAHAAACSECRDEIALIEGHEPESMPEIPDPERVWLRVLARIEDDGVPGRGRTSASRAPRAKSAPLLGARSGWAPSRRGLAAAAMLVVAFALGLVAGGMSDGGLRPDAAGEVRYEAASASSPALRREGPSLDVSFRADASVGRITQLLRATGASVVSGPTALGKYRILLPAGADVSAVAAQLMAEEDGVAILAARPPAEQPIP
jgi:anti-sigma factor RsiW